MSNVQVSRNVSYNEFEVSNGDLLGQEEGEGEVSPLIPPCPRITLSIFSVPLSALVDTGSQITAMSESFYKYLTLHGKIVDLPVSNVVLFTAIVKKPTTIKKQISCNVMINSHIIQSNFLVVPHLSNQIIIGND